MNEIKKYWKAVAGFVVPAIVVLGTAITAGSDGGTTITTSEWVAAIIAAFGTSGVVYTVPNKQSQTDKAG